MIASSCSAVPDDGLLPATRRALLHRVAVGQAEGRIGSLTKTFVAVLVMRLREEGRLDLADPLGQHLDAGPAQNATIPSLRAAAARRSRP